MRFYENKYTFALSQFVNVLLFKLSTKIFLKVIKGKTYGFYNEKNYDVCVFTFNFEKYKKASYETKMEWVAETLYHEIRHAYQDLILKILPPENLETVEKDAVKFSYDTISRKYAAIREILIG